MYIVEWLDTSGKNYHRSFIGPWVRTGAQAFGRALHEAGLFSLIYPSDHVILFENAEHMY